jgi:CBS domain containing-hemolysin-like protein
LQAECKIRGVTFVEVEKSAREGTQKYLEVLQERAGDIVGLSLIDLQKELLTPLGGDGFKRWEKVVCLRESDGLVEVLRVFQRYRFSRYPVLDSENNVLGVLHFKELMNVVKEGIHRDFSLLEYLRSVDESAVVKLGERLHSVLERCKDHHFLFVVSTRPVKTASAKLSVRGRIYNVVGIVTHGQIVKRLFMKEIEESNGTVAKEGVPEEVKQKPG